MKPRATPIPTPFQRHFHERKYGKLTWDSVALYAGTSKTAKQKGRCTNPAVLLIKTEYEDRYLVDCDDKTGYVDKHTVRLVDHPPAAELAVQSAFLYSYPRLSSKQWAICYRPDIRFVRYYRDPGFYNVQCDGKWGWVEAKHIRILSR